MFEFAYPWALLLIIAPLIVWRCVPHRPPQTTAGVQLPIVDILMSYQGKRAAGRWQLRWQHALALTLWSLLIIACAGPQWLGHPTASLRAGRNIMLALDLSGSMNTRDMKYHGQWQTRVNVVKTVAKEFIQNRPNDRIGLILFGSRAYLQTPLTFDHTSVNAMLADATVGLAGQQTAIGDAIGLAIKRLMQYPKKSRILILLTDGVNNSGNVLPLEAATMAAKEHLRIYTIGLTGSKVTVQGLFGPRVIDTSGDLDETTLQKIARLTGGLFFKAKSGAALQRVYGTLNRLEKTNDKKQSVRPVTPLYAYPLAAVFLLSLLTAILTIGLKSRPQETL